MDIAIIYEKINTPSGDSSFILKPVGAEIGEYDEQSKTFITNDADEFYSCNDTNNINKDDMFYGNLIKLEKFAKQENIKYGTEEYDDIVANEYYKKYASDILTAVIKDNQIVIDHVDLGKLSNCTTKEELSNFVDNNEYIAIRYEKQKLTAAADDNTYMMKPAGIMYGSYDMKSNVFKEGECIFYSYNDGEYVSDQYDIFFGNPCKVSDLIDIDGDVTKETLETLSEKFLKNNATYIPICICSEPYSIVSFDLNHLSSSLDEVKNEKADDIVNETISSALDMLDLELNEDDMKNLYDFYKVLIRFLYVDGKINDVTLTDVNNRTRDNCIKGLFELRSAMQSLGINEGAITTPSPAKRSNHEGITFIDIKPEEKKTFVNTLSNLKYPDYSWDDLYTGITKVVVSQDEAVAKIVSVLWKRLVELKLDNNLPSQFGMLVTGSTGVGKSEIFKTFASIVDFPVKIFDSSQITTAGYVGRNIESYLEELYYDCKCDLAKTQSAVVVLDEVDKKKDNGSAGGPDVGGKEVQNQLLKFLEGTSYNLGSQGYDHPNISIDTSGMTPICAGAFTDLFKEKKKQDLGFGGKADIEKIKQVTTKDYVLYGMSEEFMGRLYIPVHLNDLNAEALLKILQQSSKSALKIQQAIFGALGVECVFTPEYQKAVAKEAEALKTGARGLNGIVALTTFEPTQEISRHPGEYKKLVFKKATVKNPKAYELIRRD